MVELMKQLNGATFDSTHKLVSHSMTFSYRFANLQRGAISATTVYRKLYVTSFFILTVGPPKSMCTIMTL